MMMEKKKTMIQIISSIRRFIKKKQVLNKEAEKDEEQLPTKIKKKKKSMKHISLNEF